jgi:hypothetical protein
MPGGLSRRLSYGVRRIAGPRDPITQGLVLAVAPGLADGFDFSGKNHSLQIGSLLGRSATATGPTRTTLSALNASANMLSANDAWVPTSAVTVLLRKRKQDTTARAAGSFGTTSGGTTDRCGAHLPYSDGVYYFDFGGFTAGATRVSVAGGTIDTLPHTFVCTAGPRGMEIWRDGGLLVSGAFSGSRSLANAPFGLGQHGLIQNDLEDWEVFCVWDRQLSTGEIAAVTADPWRPLRAPRRRMRFVSPAAPPGVHLFHCAAANSAPPLVLQPQSAPAFVIATSGGSFLEVREVRS